MFLIFTLFSFLAGAMELCEPISTKANRDEIGGELRENMKFTYESTSKYLNNNGWILLTRDVQNHPRYKCSEVEVISRSTLYTKPSSNRFMQILEKEKHNIIKFYNEIDGYHITDHDYNRLIYTVVGVAGSESNFGNSWKFLFKNILSKSPTHETLVKCFTRLNPKACNPQTKTSRGLTQIKELPRITKPYQITRDNLDDYENAAIATMGFLIEILEWYKGILAGMCKQGSCKYKVTNNEGQEETHTFEYQDFDLAISYLYRNATKEIYSSSATPQKSCYYKKMLTFSNYIDVWYRPLSDCNQSH